MEARARTLLERLAGDADLAEVFFQDPDHFLESSDVGPADREALRHLDPDALARFRGAAEVPPRAAEAASAGAWATGLIALWVCLLGVIVWVLL